MKKLLLISASLLLLGAGCTLFEEPQEIACAYNGARYEVGDSFPAEDGCNTCYCDQDGSIACTEKACTAGSNSAGNATSFCQTAADCSEEAIDTSFCSDGAWACINSECEFQCDISGLL